MKRKMRGQMYRKKALSIIEEAYGCEQMELMHDFFLRNEARAEILKKPSAF